MTTGYCASCGSPVMAGDKFCVNCGAVLTVPTGSSGLIDAKPTTPVAAAQLASPHQVPSAVSNSASGLEIAAVITAVLAPLVGIILGIFALRSTAANYGRASALAKAATWVAVAFTTIGITATVIVGVSISNAATAARNAPFCASVASYSELLGPDGVQSLYVPMYNGDFASLSDRIAKTETYWNENQHQISAWYDQWMDLSARAPDDEWLRGLLDDQAIILDPSTGFNGPENPIVDGKDWYLVGYYAEEVNRWAEKNCG